MAAYYEKLLRLCGFDERDLAHDGPRMEKTFDKIQLDAKDMDVAEERIRKYHAIELVGVQKLIRAWLLELADMVLAREEGKKIIYYGYPSIQGPGMAIKMAGGDGLYVGCPDVILCHTVGNLFGKLDYIIKAAEENGLPSGYALCSLQQTRNGGMALGIIPVPDLVTGSSYYCDMGSKADELLHQRYGHRAVYVDGSMDSRWGEYPNYCPERVEFLGAQLNKMFATVKEVVGVETTAESQNNGMAVARGLFAALTELTMLMQADPMPISGVEQELALNLAAASTGRAISDGPDAVETLNREVKQRVEQGYGVVKKGSPRVLNFANSFSDPDITHMIEQAGLAMSLSLTTIPTPKEFITESKKYETMGEQRAQRGMIDGFYHSSFGIVRRIEEAVKALKADGVIWNYQYNCRPLSITSHIVEQWVEGQTGVPTLSLESDLYDGRSYSAAALRIRVEAFAELLRDRKLHA